MGGERITGRYYAHLNFSTVESLSKEEYRIQSSPYHVDVMKDLFDLIDESLRDKKNLFVWKARDKFFSYNMSSLAAIEMMFQKNNVVVCLFPKGEEVRHKDNFKAKYDVHLNNYPAVMKMYPYLKNTKDLLHYGWEETDEDTGQSKICGANNLISFQKVSNKDVAKSFRFKFCIIDEAGEIDCLKELTDTNAANMMLGGQKYGMTIMGGTSNANNAGYEAVCSIWRNADKLGWNKFFIPRHKALLGWVPQYDRKGLEIGQRLAIDPSTGESLVDVAEEYFQHRLNILEQIGDKSGINEFKQNYPENENDAFLRFTNSPFPVAELGEQKARIITNAQIQKSITRGNIERYVENGVIKTKFVAQDYGRWYMYLPPKPELPMRDVVGFDVVRDGGEVVDSDSKNAFVVYRPFQSMQELTGLPVCILHYRHGSLYQAFEDLVLTCMHYNAECCGEELNQMITDYFIENNATKYMCRRPSILDELGSNTKNRWFVKGNSPIAWRTSLEYAVEATKDNYQNQVFVNLIDELIDFGPNNNTDIADAYKWACLLARQQQKNKKANDESNKKKTEPKFERFLIMQGGKLVTVNSALQAQQIRTNGRLNTN